MSEATVAAAAALFIIAAKKKFRFPSNRGELVLEQLFDLPLTSKNGFDLDHVAKETHQQLKQQTEESFVATTNNPLKAELEQKLEIVKYVIEVKQAELAAQAKRSELQAKRRKLLEAVEAAEQRELGSASKEELLRQLEALDAA